ncbi:peptide chain release factor RF-3 [Sulfuriferula multivorans]|uniref:Peptide chain release factor RF-3 n=1 Tax=Sulfuriferula multivorans TaxID=1559896 RepID=A0A401JYZ5_9PROT|nr:DUF481 domain-containing protein [Sulfuriferula multivorans]GCB02302.1 peptide chain release factor RF-3 [Sulfuriferula multivorans]
MNIRQMLPIFCFFITSAQADQIVLNNGDRISGKIVRMEASKLTIKTSWGVAKKEITVSWPAVTQIELTTPAHVVLQSGEFDGTVESDGKNGMQIATGPTKGEKLRRDDILAINPTKIIDPDAFKYSGRLDAGLGFARGNTETSNYYFSGQLTYENRLNRTILKGDLHHETGANSIVTTERRRLSGKYDRFRSKRMYLYAQGILEQDRLANIDLRTTLGAGSGYQVYRGENLNLGLESGLSFIRTHFKNASVVNEPALRLGVDYDQYFWNRGLKVENSSEVFLPLSSYADMLLRSKTALLVPVGKSITTGLAFTVNWDHQPAAGKKSLDSSLQATLGYGF